jgi:hypothetical protein
MHVAAARIAASSLPLMDSSAAIGGSKARSEILRMSEAGRHQLPPVTAS